MRACDCVSVLVHTPTHACTQMGKHENVLTAIFECWYSQAQGQVLPVRMFWKAASTFVESRAEVSMKDKLFFSAIT